MEKYTNIIRKFIVLGILFVTIAIMIFWAYTFFAYEMPQMEYKADNTYNQTLVVVARDNFAPYSYENEAGELCGYDIELINLVANKLQVNVDIQLHDKTECEEMLLLGEADIMCNVNYSPKYEENSLLTSPTGKHRIVIFGLEGYSTIHELYEMKIARVKGSPIETDLHMQMGFTRLMEYASYQDAFDAAMCGEVDYVIGTYAILEYLTNTEGYPEIHAVSTIINTESFAFGISKNNSDLQTKMNIALSEINQEGLYEEIANKWLGLYIDSTINRDVIEDTVPKVLVVYSIFLFSIFFLVFVPIYNKAHRDNATKLYDKATTRKMIENRLSVSGTLMVIDINKFKDVNDTYGHAVGDVVINDIAEVLRKLSRSGDIVGRIGGDEFVVYLPKLEFETTAIQKAQQFRGEIQKKTTNNPNGVVANVSIGIAHHTSKESYEELFAKADNALYCAKKEDSHIYLYGENKQNPLDIIK